MTRRHAWLPVMIALIVATGAAAQGVGPGGDDKKQEEKVKAALAQFHKEFAEGQKKKDEGMRQTALNVLHDVCSDQRVLDALAKILYDNKEADSVKSRAALLVGMSGNLKAIPMLEKAFAANDKNDAAMEIVRAFGGMQDKSVVPIIVKIVKPRYTRFGDDDRPSSIAQCGIDALSRLRYIESIDALMEFYAGISKVKKGDPLTEPTRNAMEASIKSALQTLTGQHLEEYDQWKTWWSENKGTFKFE